MSDWLTAAQAEQKAPLGTPPGDLYFTFTRADGGTFIAPASSAEGYLRKGYTVTGEQTLSDSDAFRDAVSPGSLKPAAAATPASAAKPASTSSSSSSSSSRTQVQPQANNPQPQPTITMGQGAAAGLWTHTPVDWAGNQGLPKPGGWPTDAFLGSPGVLTGTRPKV